MKLGIKSYNMLKSCLQHYLKSKEKGIVYIGNRKSCRWKGKKEMIPKNSIEYEMIVNAMEGHNIHKMTFILNEYR